MNHFNLPLISPFKFVPNTSSPNVLSDFDGSWACERILSFETKAHYKQKWVKSDTTKLQIESSITPEDLKLYDDKGTVKKSFVWVEVFTATSYKIYETTFDISDQPEGIYYLSQRVTLLTIDWKAISEPIHSKTAWPMTMLLTYKNSFNDFDVAFTATGLSFKFRCEAAIMDFNPERERTSYVNQDIDVVTLKGTPARSFKLYIGKAAGVAPWVIDLLNRIFVCDYISIEGKLYQSADNSKWDVSRVKGYPLIGASIEIVEAKNMQSLQFADTTPLTGGIVTAYEMETDFFSRSGTTVPITDVEENQ